MRIDQPQDTILQRPHIPGEQGPNIISHPCTRSSAHWLWQTSIGKVDEILGPINQVYFTIKPQEGIQASSFKSGDKFYIGGDKLLPLEKYMVLVIMVQNVNANGRADSFQSQHLRPGQRKSSAQAGLVVVVQEDQEVLLEEASREVVVEECPEDEEVLATGEEERHEVEAAFQAGEGFQEVVALAEGEARSPGCVHCLICILHKTTV